MATPAKAPAKGSDGEGRRGFSLLEVMVSVAILGLVLTVILSAQGGLAASNKAAANMGMAITAGRCKMTEAEERLLKLGYPEIDQIDTDIPCCEDTEAQGFTCDLRVEKIELPNPPQNSLGDGGASLSLDLPGTTGGAGTAGGAAGGLGALGNVLNNPAGGAGLNFDGGLASLGSQVANQVGMGAAAGGGSGAEGMLSMVMGLVYPGLKLLMEASIRKISVTIHWKEGPNPRDLILTQYVTNPQRGGFISGALDAGTISTGGTTTGGTGTTTTPGTVK